MKQLTRPSLSVIVFGLLITQPAHAAPPGQQSELQLPTALQLALAPSLAHKGRVEAQVARDFNGDGVLDLAIVIRPATQHSLGEEGQRKLVMGLRKGNSFRAVQSSNCIAMCMECGGIMGDPFMGMGPRGKNSLVVNNYGGSRQRWSADFTVAWRKNAFHVVGVDSSVFDILRPQKVQKTSVNLLNKKYIRTGMAKTRTHHLKSIRIEECAAIRELQEPNLR